MGEVPLQSIQCKAIVLCKVLHIRGTSMGGVPREQKLLKGHLPRVIYHQVDYCTKIKRLSCVKFLL